MSSPTAQECLTMWTCEIPEVSPRSKYVGMFWVRLILNRALDVAGARSRSLHTGVVP